MNKKHIALITDDNYCLPTIVCIQSIIDHIVCADQVYVFHICTFGLQEINQNSFRKLQKDNVKVEFNIFDKSLYADKLSSVNQKSHVTPTALIKFELPNYFKYLDKLLYIDGDIAIKSDISGLFDIDIDTYYLAASFEFWQYLYQMRYTFKRKLDDKSWFNSGVMLLNLKKMREDNISEKLWDFKLHKAKTTLMDQESLIAVCSKSMLQLSVIWNFNPIFFNNAYLQDINKVYGTSFKNLAELRNEVKIIHYVGKTDKPWKYKNAHLREYWDQAFENSNLGYQLVLHDTPIAKRRNFIVATFDKVKKHGLVATLCYVINLFRRN